MMALPLLHACGQPPPQVENSGQENPTGAAAASGLLIMSEEMPGLLASTSGRLERDPKGCTIITNGESIFLAVWPARTEAAADGSSITVPRGRNGSATYRYGEWATFPGGAVSNVDGGSKSFKASGNRNCSGKGWAVAAG